MYMYQRVRANAYQTLTTLPRVFRDPRMCLRNIWTVPYEPLLCTLPTSGCSLLKPSWCGVVVSPLLRHTSSRSSVARAAWDTW